MNILLLPGANPKTVDWLKRLCIELQLNIENCVIHKYSFWKVQEQDRSLPKEVSSIPKQHYDLVLAKSLGSLILMEAILTRQISVGQAVVFGIPLKIVNDTRFNKDAFKIMADKFFFIVQQENDILGSVSELQQHSPVNLLTIEGSDHQYEKQELYIDTVNQWVRKFNIENR